MKTYKELVSQLPQIKESDEPDYYPAPKHGEYRDHHPKELKEKLKYHKERLKHHTKQLASPSATLGNSKSVEHHSAHVVAIQRELNSRKR